MRRIMKEAVVPLRELDGRRSRDLAEAERLVKSGMSEEQVLCLLGPPYAGPEGSWNYESFPPGEQKLLMQIDVFFVDGKVERVTVTPVE